MDFTDEELHKMWEEEFDILYEIGNSIGVSRSIWSADLPDDLDFSKQFATGTFIFKNRQGGNVYKLVSPTYADIWKAFEKSIIDIGPTDHIFIEHIELMGKTIHIHTES